MATRVVGGEFRGRALRTPEGDLTRPTSSLLRKVIFDLIGPGIRGRRILDVFAGAGTLGIEGISRGALHCVFVEQNRSALDILKRNIVDLKIEDRAEIVRRDSIAYLRESGLQFDGILIDPPYAFTEPLRAISLQGLLAENGWIVYQHAVSAESPIAVQYKRCREKKHGNSKITIYEC
jgi:16S rRNA (guanine(966)-N(2))-methyltransferase RsmD